MASPARDMQLVGSDLEPHWADRALLSSLRHSPLYLKSRLRKLTSGCQHKIVPTTSLCKTPKRPPGIIFPESHGVNAFTMTVVVVQQVG
ncbi:MAG: hypothetical protein JWO19_5720 [Bryobacterales bacterium]|jgi:hypothetical protein|nr:hypothetical protein [Bryobacterales bacterium]